MTPSGAKRSRKMLRANLLLILAVPLLALGLLGIVGFIIEFVQGVQADHGQTRGVGAWMVAICNYLIWIAPKELFNLPPLVFGALLLRLRQRMIAKLHLPLAEPTDG